MGNQPIIKEHSPHYRIYLHLVFVTHGRKRILDPALKYFFRTVFEQLLAQWNCTLLAYDARQSNVRLWISIHPALNISTLVNNLKTVSSRMVRKRFPEVISRHFKGPQFWQRSYYICSIPGFSQAARTKFILAQGSRSGRKSPASPKI